MSSHEVILLFTLTVAAFAFATHLLSGRQFFGKILGSALARYAWSAVAFIGVLAWWGLPPNTSRVHTWDFFHYYTGAKYFNELGYTRLYECALMVDRESASPTMADSDSVRDLESNEFVPVPRALEKASACRAQFSVSRWSEFAADVLWFRTSLGEKWKSVFNDHGFNPSPWWIWVGRKLIPEGQVSSLALQRLITVDIALIVVLWILLALTLDPLTLAVCAVFWGTNPLANGTWTAGSFLRHDWLFALVGAYLALRKRYPVLAGCLLGYSACARVFPVLFLAGGVSAFIRGAKDDAGWNRTSWLRIFCGFILASGIFVAVSSMQFGAGAWTGFIENTRKHVQTRGGNLVGLGHVADHVIECRLISDGSGADVCSPPEKITESRFSWLKRGVVLLGGGSIFLWLLWISGRTAPHEVCALSMVLVPVVTSPASYYLEALLLVAIVSQRFKGVGIGMLFLSFLLQIVALVVSPANKVYLVSSVLLIQFLAILPLLMTRPVKVGREG